MRLTEKVRPGDVEGPIRRRRARAGLAAATAALVVLLAAGCEGDRPAPKRSDEVRGRAVAAESTNPEEALGLYREAARRYPTEAWPWAGVGRTAYQLGRVADAEDALRTAARWDSTDTAIPVLLAELLLAEGRPQEALPSLDRAIDVAPDDAWTLALQGRALAAIGRDGEATKALDRAVALAPDDARVRAAAAFRALTTGSPDAALASLESLRQRFPEDPEVALAHAAALRATGQDTLARATLERVIALDPYRFRARRELARLDMNGGELQSALEHWRVLLERNPKDAVALRGLGECSLAGGDPVEAERAYREALRADPESAPAHLALGRLLAETDRPAEAVASLRKARARASLEPELWERCSVELGHVYLSLGESENALRVAEAVLARAPASTAGRSLRGTALAAGGAGVTSPEELERSATSPEATRDEILAYGDWLLKNGDAERTLVVTERLGANDRDVRVLRARARVALEQTDTAEAELHDVLSAHENTPAAHLALGRLYLAQNRLPDALFHANEGARLAPNDAEFALLRGQVSMAEKRYEDARVAFERQRELSPEDPGPWLNLGRLELEIGRAAEAAACFAEARDLDAGSWRAPYLLGLAEAESGRPEEAVEAYRTALARNERLAEAHNNLAWLLADLDLDPVLAEVHARRAAELQPENADVLGTLGWAQYKNRMLAEATASLERAAELQPHDAWKRYMLGVVLFHRGQRQEARGAVESALRLDPDFPRADAARALLARMDG